MNDDRLRTLALDITTKPLLQSLKQNNLFSVTVSKLRTATLSMKLLINRLYGFMGISYTINKRNCSG